MNQRELQGCIDRLMETEAEVGDLQVVVGLLEAQKLDSDVAEALTILSSRLSEARALMRVAVGDLRSALAVFDRECAHERNEMAAMLRVAYRMYPREIGRMPRMAHGPYRPRGPRRRRKAKR